MIQHSRQLGRIQGLVHGLSTRQGGVSAPPFNTLNLGRGLGDSDASVDANVHCFRALVGLEDHVKLAQVKQVHGDRVLPIEGPVDDEEADGLITWTPRVALAIRTADCAPILIAHAPNGTADAIAAVHAGWRGATAKILARALEGLVSLGAKKDDLYFAIGPTIGPDAFEVGDGVIEAARQSTSGSLPATRRDGRWFLDLRSLLIRHLDELDIAIDRVDLVGGCTSSNPSMYFSHRRDAGQTGRHLAVIALDG